MAPPADVNAKNISELITQDSELNIEELEHYCLQGQYYKALALIYRHTHRYRKALEVWSKYVTLALFGHALPLTVLNIDWPRTSTSIPPRARSMQPRPPACTKRAICWPR